MNRYTEGGRMDQGTNGETGTIYVWILEGTACIQ